MAMPNFLVIGAMKGGTTSLHRYLGQHPDIFMSRVKEPKFFARQSVMEMKLFAGRTPDVRDFAEYRALFDEAGSHAARGEATPLYLCDSRAPAEIRRHIPDAKLIAILRQPVDRAYSAYVMKRRQGLEHLEFEDALAEEPNRIAKRWDYSWHYAGLSRYTEQLERYYGLFGRTQIKVILSDDLLRDTRGVLQDLFRFLGVDDSFEPDVSTRHNEAALSRSPRLYRWLIRPSAVREGAKRILPAGAQQLWRRISRASLQLNERPAPRLAPSIRERLTREWTGEIQSLQALIGQDLTRWCEPARHDVG
jgi:hypothetical protein